MLRKDIKKDADLLYYDGVLRIDQRLYRNYYRARVLALTPTQASGYMAPNHVYVRIYLSDGSKTWELYRQEADTGFWYADKVVPTRALHGDFAELHQKISDASDVLKKAAESREAKRVDIECQLDKIRDAAPQYPRHHVSLDGDLTTVKVPVDLLVELFRGWDWAMAENSNAQTGELTSAPWREVSS